MEADSTFDRSTAQRGFDRVLRKMYVIHFAWPVVRNNWRWLVHGWENKGEWEPSRCTVRLEL